MNKYFTFHLTANSRRTTVSLDPELAMYLAKSFGFAELSSEAKAEIRNWAAKSLAEDNSLDKNLPLSAKIRRLAIRRIVDPRFLEPLKSSGETERAAGSVQNWRQRLNVKRGK